MNDLLEQIVGDFEPDAQGQVALPEIEQSERDGEPVWHIRGSAPMREVEAALKVSFPDNECDTFGGYVFSVIGAVPDDGCQMDLRANGLLIHLEKIEEHQLVRAEVSRLASQVGEEAVAV